MFSAMLLTISAVALAPFGVFYWRAVLPAYRSTSPVDSRSFLPARQPRPRPCVFQIHPHDWDLGCRPYFSSSELGRKRTHPVRALRCGEGGSPAPGESGARRVDSLLLT